MFVLPLPSAFITKIWLVVSDLVNAILSPLADHAGWKSFCEESFVRLTGPLPSGLMSKICALLAKFPLNHVKAILPLVPGKAAPAGLAPAVSSAAAASSPLKSAALGRDL
jgi:hypothetical protein